MSSKSSSASLLSLAVLLLPFAILPIFIALERIPRNILDASADLGANSVDRAEIAMFVQESIGLSVPRVELYGPTNIGELADLFLKKLNAA